MGVIAKGAEIVNTNGNSHRAQELEQQRERLQKQQDKIYQQCVASEDAAICSHQEAERAAAQSAEAARQAAERSAADARATAERAVRDASDAADRDRARYNEELFRMTAEAANKPSDEPHSAFPGATAGQIHSDPNTVLQPRDYSRQ